MSVPIASALDLQGVDHQRRAPVALDAIQTARRLHQREHRRPKALTAREALAALRFETLLVFVAAGNIRNGVELSENDFERLAVACSRIETIAEEAA